MKDHFFQQIRLRVKQAGETVPFNVESNKNYKRLKGVFLSVPQENIVIGATLGLKINGIEVFGEDFEARALYGNTSVPTNERFFLFEEDLVAAGTSVSGVYRDGQGNPNLFANGQDMTGVIDPLGSVPLVIGGANPFNVTFPHDIKLILWLTNQELTLPHNVVKLYQQAYEQAHDVHNAAMQAAHGSLTAAATGTSTPIHSHNQGGHHRGQ